MAKCVKQSRRGGLSGTLVVLGVVCYFLFFNVVVNADGGGGDPKYNAYTPPGGTGNAVSLFKVMPTPQSAKGGWEKIFFNSEHLWRWYTARFWLKLN